MNVIDTKMSEALAREGRGFGPGGSGAPKPTPRPEPRKIRDGDILLGSSSNGDQVGISLGKLIEGRMLIQGNSGAGKSMLLRRLFEQAFGKVQQVVVDPDGEFLTLAEKFDVAVLASAEILRVGGRALARHIRAHRYSAILDLSDATSEQRLETAAEFAAGLIEAPAEHWHPLLVLIDEAQTFAPHYDTGDVETETRKRAISAIADMMGRGRKRGVAGVIATQRLAETSKAVAFKTTNVIVGRTIFDRDLERAGDVLGFTAGHSRALRTLADGEFIGIGPAFNIAGRSRFKAGGVETRHKGEAPRVEAPPPIAASAAMALLSQVEGLDADDGDDRPRGNHRPASGRRGRDWRADEDQIIRDGYRDGMSIADIGQALAGIGFSTSTSNISMRAHALGLVSAKAAVGWSADEDEIVRQAYAREVKIMDIVGLLAEGGFTRGRVAIQMRAIALGITRDRVNYWTEPEKAIALAGLENGKPYREIIAELKEAGFDRGMTSIFKFAQKHNFDRSGEAWTTEQIEELKKLYAEKMPAKQIAERLGKLVGAIRTKASNLGLKQRVAWSDADYIALQKAWTDGKTLTEAVELIGRPYANVARVAANIKLNFSIKPGERGKAASAAAKSKPAKTSKAAR
ncbi:DUF87 domain-containing protein [Bradyrhizobium sp. KBS0727]|uniref:helicase HerA domain-containing protein n=1 Tax=unclassified Bradyrhizobium TaxID=2631580 RepID=UPI00110D7635|nr:MULTISPECIES: DUF87 domain-containing protein [unclassified Bradyrhizobium]QDW39019.1 DUF87 domain-containing protein [Bradyrhizobium sp. KBS0725]QDW45622.1 DUF87 domain-containing protein [Bradyrhizobium sp. KBS0727]